MKILHTIAGVWVGTGGPATSVPGLCDALARRGHGVTLLTGEGRLAPAVKKLTGGVELVTKPLGPYWTGNYSRSFAAACGLLAIDCEVLHTHGLWLHPNIVTSAAGRKLGKAVVVSPRGMLAPWALERGRLRKRLVWHLVQRRCLDDAAFIHATSREEACEVRRARITAPIALIPNGVALSDFPLHEIDAMQTGGRTRRVLFLSRVHPKKGVRLLLDAWRMVAERHPSVELVIAGPGERHHIDELRLALADESLERAHYVGLVEGREKLELLARSTVVVLPSHSENYGMVIAEALACRTPVIVSTGVPWESVESERVGWRVDVEVDVLAQAMDEALLASDDRIDEMGLRGRRLIERDHSVEFAAGMMTRAYEWACGRASMPEFVDVVG